jgi:outer membrane lipoprotein-sorting protein
MTQRQFNLVAACIALMLATGCGSSGPTTPKRSVPARTQMPVQQQMVMPQVAPGQDQGLGAQMLQKVRGVLQTATGFSADVTAKTEGMYKSGERVSEVRHVTMGYRVIWAKPNKFRALVTKAPSALMEGATLVTTDGKNVTARAGGVLSVVPIQAQANDKRIANARNHTFDKFNPGVQMQRLTGATAVWTYVDQFPGATGAPVIRCAIDGVPRLDGEIDREIIAIDTGNNTLRSLTSFVKGKPVVEYTFPKFAWNPKISSDTFQL